MHFPIFHPMSNFTRFLGLLFQLTHTHTKIIFSHLQSHVGTIRRLLITEVPVGHFRRLIFSTPNREGSDTPLHNYSIPFTQPTQNQQTVSQHVSKSMTHSHIFLKLFCKINPCSLVKLSSLS